MRHKLLTTVLALLLIFSFIITAGAETMERVNLHFSHVGADSTNFSTESDCGGVNAGVVWHLVLNQLDPGTEPQTLHTVFENAGHLKAIGRSVGNGSVQHFFVGTTEDDVLLEAYVDVPGQSRTPKLLLSHVCLKDHKDEDEKKDDSDIEDNDKDKKDETDKEDKKETETDVPGDDPQVDPDKERTAPKDPIDDRKELPQTGGSSLSFMSLSVLLSAGGLLLKSKKY